MHTKIECLKRSKHCHVINDGIKSKFSGILIACLSEKKMVMLDHMFIACNIKTLPGFIGMSDKAGLVMLSFTMLHFHVCYSPPVGRRHTHMDIHIAIHHNKVKCMLECINMNT